ncbi:gliding motility-associated C-terminal domain-containing protein, partial [Flavobacteriales bacterium]|nr:gliding motility-associated C-terminal domain-containing protein [Flavobacteriales bacterium]
DTMIKTLEILPRPIVSATGGEMCFGGSALITASGAMTYSWNDSIEILHPDSSASYAFANQTITYTVTGTDTSGCLDTAQATVTVIKEQNLIEERECIVIGETATIGFDYGPGYTYDWTAGPTEFLVCKECAVQTVSIIEEVDSIEYEVAYSDSLGCFPKVNKYTVCVEDKYTVDVPSAFTPNGAGENNIVYVKGHGVQELVYFRIYNRWGEMVFETNNINEGWNGNYKGQAQDMETFVYQAKVKFYNDTFGEKGGEITLIR